MPASLAVTALIACSVLAPGSLAAQHRRPPPGPGTPHAGGQPIGQHAGGQPAGARTPGQAAPAPARAPVTLDPWDSAIGASRRARARDSAAALQQAQQPPPPPGTHTPEQRRQRDTARAEMQRRVQPAAVGATTTTPRMDDLPDGGRIELQRDGDDPQGAAQLRRRLADMASQFTGAAQATGPAAPGTAVMAAKRAVIVYSMEILPRGAALRITSQDPEAVAAIHQYLAFRRRRHAAAPPRPSPR